MDDINIEAELNDIIPFNVRIMNNGPDTAYNIVYTDLATNLGIISRVISSPDIPLHIPIKPMSISKLLDYEIKIKDYGLKYDNGKLYIPELESNGYVDLGISVQCNQYGISSFKAIINSDTPNPHLCTFNGNVIITVPEASCRQIHDSFSRPAIGYGTDYIILPDVSYTWDGEGSIYIADNCQNTQISADDQLIMSTSKGSLTYTNITPAWVTPGSPLNITDLLSVGNNIISMRVNDIFGTSIGYPSYYIMRG